MPRMRLLLALTLALAGCAGSSSPGAPARSPDAPAKVQPDPGGPADLSPNTLRDRRAQAGVRAPAKALVLDNARSVRCGKLAKGSEGDEVELLGGRLRVRPPVNAKVPPPPPNAPPAEEESRLVAEAAKVSMAIVARETFQLDPDLYEAEDPPTRPGTLDVEAAKFLKATFPSEEPLQVTPVEIGPSKMRAYAARPPNPNAPPGKDTALVLALLLAQEDGTLETVGFYVRGEMVREATGSDLVGCTRLAERIASSIVPGARKLERAAGRRTVLDVDDHASLTVTVPADYVAIRAGSASARLTKLRPLSLYQGSISVVVATAAEAGKTPEGADAKTAGKLLGRPTEWHGKTTPKGGFLFAAEPLLDDRSKIAEVLVKATRQAKALDEMRGVAETLAVVKK